MNIACFRHTCATCGYGFNAPALSDFQYGAFIMCSDSGLHDAFLDAFDDKIWNEVDDLIQKNKPLLREKFWEVFALTCDLAPDGTKFEIGLRKCPRCRSTSLSRETDNTGISLDVPAITHNAWCKLTAEQKRSRILK